MSEQLSFKVERIHRLEKDGAVKAFVDLAINGAVLLKGLRIVEGEKGIFVAMPKTQGKDQRWYDNIRLLTKDVRAQVSKIILDDYKKEE